MGDTASGLLTVAALLGLLAAAYVPLGDYMAAVLTPARHNRVERVVYRTLGVNPDGTQSARSYLLAVLAFSAVSILVLFLILLGQGWLPFSRGLPGMPWEMAMNTAISFVTNTNWQSYAGESTLGYTAQMAGLAVQNFASAAVGIAVAAALVRAFLARRVDEVGNFWVDMVRVNLRLLLPIALIGAVLLLASGVVQNFAPDLTVPTLGGQAQTIPGGPVASQEVIKDLGTNGGGFFNANSAHPYENPGPLSNLLEVFLLLVIPVALTRTLGTMLGNRKQGLAILGAMAALWLGALVLTSWAELAAGGQAPALAGAATEGKETRFGIWASALFAVSTTATSTGSVNAMHDSMTPAGGGVVLLNILLGEVSPGGVGSGLYGMLIMAVLAVFVAGLMVGRTPEFLGKKISAREMTFVALYVLTTPALVLLGTGVAIALPSTAEAMNNAGAHGFSEVLYAYASAANNNGSAFAGITVTSVFFQLTLGVAMLLGRLVGIALVLGLAGSLARSAVVPRTTGTLPTHTPLFVTLLVGVVLLVGGLTFFPGLALGPDRGGTVMTTIATPPPVRTHHAERGGRVSVPGSGVPLGAQIGRALPEAFRKLAPQHLWRSPVMFLVWLGSVLTTILAVVDPSVFTIAIAVWLWLTVLFGNLAEAVAEGRGKAQADTLRAARTDTVARRLDDPTGFSGPETAVPSSQLRPGDLVRVVGRSGHPRRR